MTISQREARRLKRRVIQLEDLLRRQREGWRADYPGGVNIATVELPKDLAAITAVRTARRLGHAVVAVEDRDELRLYALPHPRKD